MLRIDDFRLYIRPDGSITDDSLNNYSITNSNVTLDTNKNGVSDKAMLFNSSSDELQLTSSVAQSVANDMNGGCSIYFELFNDNVAGSGGRLFGQMDDLVFSFSLGISVSDSPSPIYFFTTNSSGTAQGATSGDFTKGQWSSLLFTTEDKGSSQIEKKIIYDGTTIQTRTDNYNITNRTEVLRIGRHSTSQNFQGKISQIIVKRGQISELEQKFISKFEDMKRIA